jgi:hypothetical protein
MHRLRSAAASAQLPRVLLVNHGYPPSYNAGSEIYTQTVAAALAARGAGVAVFSRRDDPFQPDYALARSADSSGVPLLTVNYARSQPPRFCDAGIDAAFRMALEEHRPGASN